MSGRDKAAESRQASIAEEQARQQKALTDAYSARLAQGDAMRDPAIKYAQGVASNPLQTLKAAQGGLFDVDRSTKAGLQSVMDSVPEGAARDVAMAQIRASAPVARQQASYDSFMQALNILGGFGTENTNTALQQLGAGMRSGEAGVATNQSLINAAAQRQANMFGMIGQIGGMAGNLATMGWGSAASKGIKG